MYEDFGDRVDVCARFSRGNITPLWFLWRGRKYDIQRVTFSWEERRGKAMVKHFSVTDGASVFEIGYDSEKLDWKLISLYTD